MTSRRFAVALNVVAWCLAAIVMVLCVKGVVDVYAGAARFPAWFPPLLAFGAISAGLFTIYLTAQSQDHEPRRGGIAVAAWLLLALSFVTVSSLHSFMPFRFGLAAEAWVGWPSIRLNLFMTGAGAVVALALGAVYATNRNRGFVAAALPLVALFLLIPNDDCANPFNVWWIDAIGFSPLMFVPNAIGAICVRSALTGATPWLALAGLVNVCLSTLFLGLGHRTDIIW